MYLLLAFLVVPLIEIALFIQIGGALGLWPTLAIVVVTALFGATMMRRQGAFALRDLQVAMSGRGDPERALAHGAMIVFSGALLLTPGFFTDTVGLALLVPRVRTAVFEYLRSAGSVRYGFSDSETFSGKGPHRDSAQRPTGAIIEGEYTDLDKEGDEAPRAPGKSRH